MVDELRFTNVRRVLDDLTDHPKLSDLTLEKVVRYCTRFMAIQGYNKIYLDEETEVPISEYRGLLPCNMVRIIQVKDNKSGLCMKSMTDSFVPSVELSKCTLPSEHSFKTQGQVIYTSFPEGCVTVAYKAIPIDDEGLPMIPDDEVYLDALESFIKVRVFTTKYEQGKIAAGVLQNAQNEYAWASGRLNSHMTIPSISEMESIGRNLMSVLPKNREFDKGFRTLGDRKDMKIH